MFAGAMTVSIICNGIRELTEVRGMSTLVASTSVSSGTEAPSMILLTTVVLLSIRGNPRIWLGVCQCSPTSRFSKRGRPSGCGSVHYNEPYGG